jgi:hypothetical protein
LNTSETNRRIAEQFNEAFNRGDLDAAASCFAEDCQNHGRKVGRAGVRMVLREIKTNFPDAKLTTRVVVRCTYSGTHRGTSCFPVDGGMLLGGAAHGSDVRGSAHPHVPGARWRDRRALREPRRCRNDAAAWSASAAAGSIGWLLSEQSARYDFVLQNGRPLMEV